MAHDDRRAQHGDGHAVGAEQSLDLAPRAQVGRQLPVIVAETAHVDDLADTGRCRGGAEVAGGVGVLALEVGVVEGVDEVDRHVDALQRGAQGVGVGDVGADRRALAVVRLGAAGHGADVVAGLDQGGDQAATDEAGRTGDENCGHGPTLSARSPRARHRACADAFRRASRRDIAGVAVTPCRITDTMIVKATVDHSHGSSGTCSCVTA